jgi:hypothetical protein
MLFHDRSMTRNPAASATSTVTADADDATIEETGPQRLSCAQL